MPSPSQVLRMETLERRDVPAVLGNSWSDVSALTLSFAPDDTAIGQAKSDLFSLLKKTGSNDEWQLEILRAFQTWAVATNGNVAVVKDGKQAFGVGGDTQGDNRFGDIRIGAVSLSADAVATASPFDPRIGTWSGDVVLNADKKFAIGSTSASVFDLYTVALHEAGHVFGVDHSDDRASAMTEGYHGTKTGLTSADVAMIRAVYGVRAADLYEGGSGNGSFATATALPPAAYRELVADLSAVGDVDTFSFTVPAGSDKAVVLLRTAGISSVAARIEVFDASGKLVAVSDVTDPLDPKDQSLKLSKLKADAKYFVRVSSPVADVFAVGRYSLTLNLDDVKTNSGSKTLEDKHTNETLATATALAPESSGRGSNKSTSYEVDAKLEDKTDRDVYRLASPTDPAADALRIEIRNLKGDKLPPTVRVFNAAGVEQVVQVLESSGSKMTIQVLGIQRGATYFVALASPTSGDATGDYRMTAEFGEPVANGLTQLDTGAVSSALPEAGGTLVVESARLFNFSLAVTGTTATTNVDLQVFDEAGKLVGTWAVDPTTGRAAVAVFLPPGRYRLSVVLEVKKGQSVAPLRYWLFGGVSSDPMGPLPTNTGSLPGTTADSSTAPPPPPATSPSTTPPATTSPFLFVGPISSIPIGYAYKS